MPKPNTKHTLPDFSGQTKMLFITEGNPTALLVKTNGFKRQSGVMKMATAEAALAWCRAHAAMLIYTPLNAAVN